jgi:acyl carrier protein
VSWRDCPNEATRDPLYVPRQDMSYSELTFEEYAEELFTMMGLSRPETFLPASDLYSDLDLDSLQTFELLVVTEQIAGLHVAMIDIPTILTLEDAYLYYIRALVAARDPDW